MNKYMSDDRYLRIYEKSCVQYIISGTVAPLLAKNYTSKEKKLTMRVVMPEIQ